MKTILIFFLFISSAMAEEFSEVAKFFLGNETNYKSIPKETEVSFKKELNKVYQRLEEKIWEKIYENYDTSMRLSYLMQSESKIQADKYFRTLARKVMKGEVKNDSFLRSLERLFEVDNISNVDEEYFNNCIYFSNRTWRDKNNYDPSGIIINEYTFQRWRDSTFSKLVKHPKYERSICPSWDELKDYYGYAGLQEHGINKKNYKKRFTITYNAHQIYIIKNKELIITSKYFTQESHKKFIKNGFERFSDDDIETKKFYKKFMNLNIDTRNRTFAEAKINYNYNTMEGDFDDAPIVFKTDRDSIQYELKIIYFQVRPGNLTANDRSEYKQNFENAISTINLIADDFLGSLYEEKIAEEERLEKERIAEEERISEENRRERERIAEEERLERERIAEEERIAAEEERIAAEEERIAEEKRIAEENRIARERRRKVAEELRKLKEEEKRIAKEKRIAEEKRLAKLNVKEDIVKKKEAELYDAWYNDFFDIKKLEKLLAEESVPKRRNLTFKSGGGENLKINLDTQLLGKYKEKTITALYEVHDYKGALISSGKSVTFKNLYNNGHKVICLSKKSIGVTDAINPNYSRSEVVIMDDRQNHKQNFKTKSRWINERNDMLRNHFQKKGKVFLYTNAELNKLFFDADYDDEDISNTDEGWVDDEDDDWK